MTPTLLDALRARTPAIHVRWEALLRIERVSGPLANPDALVRLIPDSLAQIMTALSHPPRAAISLQSVSAQHVPTCDCGYNPYLAYFVAGEQALIEAVVLLQTELPVSATKDADVAAAVRAVRTLARSEIDTFCGLCTHRGGVAKCRFPAAPAETARTAARR